MSQKKEQNQEPKKHDAYDLRAAFEEIEIDLIQNLRRNLKHHAREEEEEGFRWEMWQKAKLRNIWKYRKQNQEIVGQHSKEIEDLVNKTLQESFGTAESALARIISRVKAFFTRRGMSFPKDIPHKSLDKPARPEEDFFGVNEKKIDALQETAQALQEPQKRQETNEAEKIPAETEKPKEEALPNAEELFKPAGEEKTLEGKNNDQKLEDLKEQVAQDMKEVQGAIWRRMDDIYRQTIYKAEMFMAAGAKTLDQAIDLATKEFLNGGIDCIEYKNGRRVNIASYAEMALRTASQRAVFLAEGKKRDEWGIHTIFVSAHANTCPKCEPWQGKVLVDDVFSSGTAAEAAELGVSLLSTAMKAGLLHPNCRHTLATYFPGITILPKVPDGKKAVKTYEAEQKQRALERAIRKAKRKVAGACDNDNIRKEQEELMDLQEKMKIHLNQHPELRQAYGREKLRGIPETMQQKMRDGMSIKLPDEIMGIKGMTNDGRIRIEKAITMMQKRYNIQIGEISVERMGKTERGTYFMAGPYLESGRLKMGLVINQDIDYTVIDKIFSKKYESGFFASRTLEDGIKHELAHIMTIQGCKTYEEYQALKNEVPFVPGISGYADSCKDGMESLAEAFVRMQNGEKIPLKARILVNKYIGRWKS